jgi:hypothetical protein
MMRIIGIISVILLAGSSAFGQFMVNPMRVQTQVYPGRQSTTSISVNNTQLDRSQKVDLRIVDLTQASDGQWERIEIDDPRADSANLPSCRGWLSLERASVDLPPGQIHPVRIQINVPRGTSGYYFAAIIASMQPREAELEGWTAPMSIEFLIPVILDVRGRVLRTDVKLMDVGLAFQAYTEETLEASLVNLTIQNAGMTFSRLEAIARISKRMGGRWRRITEVKIPPDGDLGIIPGVTLNLSQDVGRALPAGEYRVQGFLVADGRRADQVDKEFYFAGDPRVREVSADAALDLSPIEVVINTIPGQTRREYVEVFNASEEPVDVDVTVALPEHMVGTVLPEDEQGRTILGDQFGCMDWLAIQPEQFSLKGYGRQRVQIRCQMPETAIELAEYYSLVKLHARYPDGQPAGTTTGRVCVDNTRAQAAPRVEIVQLTFGGTIPSRYAVVARCVNLGDTRIMPRCRAVVRTYPDSLERVRIPLTSEAYAQTGHMLPLEYRMFQGVMDISDLAPGIYRLAVVLDHDKAGEAQRQKAFRVIEEGGVKSIEELGLDAVGGAIPVRL